MIIETRAYARAGLLGNPSDGYFGKTISIIVKNFGAHISLYESPELVIEMRPEDSNVFSNIHSFVESVKLHGYYGGDRLIKAAIKTFYEYCAEIDFRLENKNFSIRYSSNIPRQVGLAGSSAIITATMRALSRFYNVNIPEEILPTVVLNCEAKELGINAGLQDRVIQSYEGCVYMDFEKNFMDSHKHGIYERLDPSKLKNLFIAYKQNLGKVSGAVLNDIYMKYIEGDPLVIETLDKIAECAEKGKIAIEAGDVSELNRLINLNFDLRGKIMNIKPKDREIVETARRCGASAKFAGSGGSTIGVYEDDEMLTKLIVEMKKINVRVIKPYIS